MDERTFWLKPDAHYIGVAIVLIALAGAVDTLGLINTLIGLAVAFGLFIGGMLLWCVMYAWQ
jgi:hypothetical protein